MTARRTLAMPTAPEPIRAEDWRDYAACTAVDPELFFIGGYPSAWHHHPDAAARAKAICDTCPVVAECIAHADAIGDGHSIRGGLTPDQRARMRRKGTRTRPSRAGATT